MVMETLEAMALAAALWIGVTSPVFAETTILICPANNGVFEFSVDFDNNTVSSSSEGAPYTVPANITERVISWDAPGGSSGTHLPTTIDRVTGAIHRDLCTPQGGCTGGYDNECHKGEKKF